MPIYEYYCTDCGHEFELTQKITDNPIRKCQKCGKLKAKRMISQTAFVLKGTGWYVTDYSGKKAAPKSEKARSSDSDTSDSSSADKPSDVKSSDKSSNKSSDKNKKAANA